METNLCHFVFAEFVRSGLVLLENEPKHFDFEIRCVKNQHPKICPVPTTIRELNWPESVSEDS